MVDFNEFLNDEISSEEKNEVKLDILLIDLSDEIYEKLEVMGFNVSKGSFGTPYNVQRSEEYKVVIGEENLPVISEQDIVIIDLHKDHIHENEVEYIDPGDVKELFDKCDKGWIDPRPKYMFNHRDNFDRIFKNGGIFVIFAERRYNYNFLIAKNDSNYIRNGRDVEIDNWSLLPIFNDLAVYKDEGREIKITWDNSAFKEFFKKYLSKTSYNSRFESYHIAVNYFTSILTNKFNQSVGCIIRNNLSETSGYVLILPDMPRTPELVLDLLNDVLPSISPHLFPNVKGKWIEEDEYEFKSIKDLKNQIKEIAIKAKTKIEKIEEDISSERREYGFLHGILTGTGDELVDDVQECLKFIGFNNVVDADEFVKEGEDKEEDLQILDNEVNLLVEVKGPSTKTKNTYVNQISNYVSRRRKEWKTFDLDGVLIINHQRNIPPLKRDNTSVFTRNQINDAERDDICLITTWELFLLIKGMMKYNWNPRVIRDLFYQSGRIPVTPSNYEPIGQIFTIMKDKGVIGVEINKGGLYKGQRIGYRIFNEFFEETVESLQIDGNDIERTTTGNQVGVTSKFTEELKTGLTVYKIT
ncbi:MAG: hypothetical protein ACC609_09590 [Methanobacterium formicicum]